LFTSIAHNPEAEQALLGAMLVNNRAYERVSEFLAPAAMPVRRASPTRSPGHALDGVRVNGCTLWRHELGLQGDFIELVGGRLEVENQAAGRQSMAAYQPAPMTGRHLGPSPTLDVDGDKGSRPANEPIQKMAAHILDEKTVGHR
jgi:hypothetical protein